jgi:hypothetical protein
MSMGWNVEPAEGLATVPVAPGVVGAGETESPGDVPPAIGENASVGPAEGDTDAVADGAPAPGPAMTAAAPRATTARIATPAAIPLRRDRRDVTTRRL